MTGKRKVVEFSVDLHTLFIYISHNPYNTVNNIIRGEELVEGPSYA